MIAHQSTCCDWMLRLVYSSPLPGDIMLLSIGLGYGKDSPGPEIEYQSARGLRVSPLYTRAHKAGAVFGENVGFERALYFTSNVSSDDGKNAVSTNC